MSCCCIAVASPGRHRGPLQKGSTPEDTGGVAQPFAPHHLVAALSPDSKLEGLAPLNS